MRNIRQPRVEDLAALPPTMDVVTAGAFFGLGRDASYAAARSGEFPCRVLRIGNRMRVPRGHLAAALGVPDPGIPLASGTKPQVNGTARDPQSDGHPADNPPID